MVDKISQRVTLPATPMDVYETLISSARHAKFSGAPAKISPKVGGAVSAYGGYISAVNLALKPGKTIVQAWRTKNWPAHHWSVVRYELKAVKGGRTNVTFTQHGVPPRHFSSIAKGWHAAYWTPMRNYFAERR